MLKQPMAHSYWQEEINKKIIHVRLLNRKNLMMSKFCLKTQLFAPEWWKCIQRGPDFKIFPRRHAFRPPPPLETRAFAKNPG